MYKKELVHIKHVCRTWISNLINVQILLTAGDVRVIQKVKNLLYIINNIIKHFIIKGSKEVLIKQNLFGVYSKIDCT